MEIYVCFFCEEEYFSRSELQKHQQSCDSRPPELKIICPPSPQKNLPTPPQISPKATVYTRPSKDTFIGLLGLVQGDKAHVMKTQEEAKEEVDCMIIEIEEAPHPSPVLSPTTPLTPKRLLPVLSPLANRRFEGVFPENNASDLDSECSRSDIVEREPQQRILPKSGTSLLAIDLCSPLGQRIKKHVKVDASNSAAKRPHYEQFCHTPVKDKFRERLRDRAELYPITFKRRGKYKHEHVYKFTKRQKRQFMAYMETGLCRKSRALMRSLVKCSVLLERLAPSEIRKWQRPFKIPVIDIEPLSEGEIFRWTHPPSPTTFPSEPVLLSKDLDRLLGLKKKPFISSPQKEIRRQLTLSQVVSETVNAEVAQQTVTVYKSLLNEYAQDCKRKEENANAKRNGWPRKQATILLAMLSTPPKDTVPSSFSSSSSSLPSSPASASVASSSASSQAVIDQEEDKPCDKTSNGSRKSDRGPAAKSKPTKPASHKPASIKPRIVYTQSRYSTRLKNSSASRVTEIGEEGQQDGGSEHAESYVDDESAESQSESGCSERSQDGRNDNASRVKVAGDDNDDQDRVTDKESSPSAKATAMGDLKIRISFDRQQSEGEEERLQTRRKATLEKKGTENTTVSGNSIEAKYGLRSRKRADSQNKSERRPSVSEQKSTKDNQDRTPTKKNQHSTRAGNDLENISKSPAEQLSTRRFYGKSNGVADDCESPAAAKNDLKLRISTRRVSSRSSSVSERESSNNDNITCSSTAENSPKSPVKCAKGDLKLKISLKRSLSESPTSGGNSPPEKRICLDRIELRNVPASRVVNGISNTSSLLFKCKVCSMKQVYRSGGCDAIKAHVSSKHANQSLDIVRHRPKEAGYDITVFEIVSANSQSDAETDSVGHVAPQQQQPLGGSNSNSHKPMSVVRPTQRRLFLQKRESQSPVLSRRTSSPLQPHRLLNLNPQAPAKAPISSNASIEPAATERLGFISRQQACDKPRSPASRKGPSLVSSDEDEVMILKEVICLDA